jgi:hypothetical protein
MGTIGRGEEEEGVEVEEEGKMGIFLGRRDVSIVYLARHYLFKYVKKRL